MENLKELNVSELEEINAGGWKAAVAIGGLFIACPLLGAFAAGVYNGANS